MENGARSGHAFRMGGNFPQIVFSGGGLRCFWQGGFMDVVRDALDLTPERITGVSGGALSAAGFIAHRGHAILEAMCDAFESVDHNISLDDMDEEDGRTPHQRVFREVLEKTITAEAENTIAAGPSFQILIARPPGENVPGLTGTAMTLAYEAELHLVNSPHFTWAERFGLTPELVDARRAASEGRLRKLIQAAVTIPPVFRTIEWDGAPVVDGGMADMAPMPEPDEGATLILLTRQYRRLPEVAGRLYVTPSAETPADKIDFTDPETLRKTWELGQRDGKTFLEDFRNR